MAGLSAVPVDPFSRGASAEAAALAAAVQAPSPSGGSSSASGGSWERTMESPPPITGAGSGLAPLDVGSAPIPLAAPSPLARGSNASAITPVAVFKRVASAWNGAEARFDHAVLDRRNSRPNGGGGGGGGGNDGSNRLGSFDAWGSSAPEGSFEKASAALALEAAAEARFAEAKARVGAAARRELLVEARAAAFRERLEPYAGARGLGPAQGVAKS